MCSNVITAQGASFLSTSLCRTRIDNFRGPYVKHDIDRNAMRLLLFYTDPGSGMLLLQIIFASVAGTFYFFRSTFFRLIGRGKTAEAEVKEDKPDIEKSD